jgi:hypothetical protein
LHVPTRHIVCSMGTLPCPSGTSALTRWACAGPATLVKHHIWDHCPNYAHAAGHRTMGKVPHFRCREQVKEHTYRERGNLELGSRYGSTLGMTPCVEGLYVSSPQVGSGARATRAITTCRGSSDIEEGLPSRTILSILWEVCRTRAL